MEFKIGDKVEFDFNPQMENVKQTVKGKVIGFFNNGNNY